MTQLIAAAGDDPNQRARLFLLIYEELKSLARRELGPRPHDQTLSTGPLVHEAYLKLFPKGQGSFENRRHFFGAAARAMRQVVIEYARARLAECRGQGRRALKLDDIDPSQLQLASQAEELVQIDAALAKLAEIDQRALQVAELRYFVGLQVPEISEVLGVSEPTVKRDARFVRTFLRATLGA